MTQFLQASFDGIALGSQYALIVLGFVVIYRATGIINFAQGGALLLGAYMTYNVANTWGWNFYLAILVSAVVVAVFSVLLQRAMLQRVFREVAGVCVGLIVWASVVYNGGSHPVGVLVGLVVGLVVWQVVGLLERRFGSSGPSELPLFGAIMVTIGVLFVVKQVIASIWGFGELSVEDPWEISTWKVGDLIIQHARVATIVLALIGLGLFFLIDRYTRIGVAMRATHFDHEAAIAQGIPTKWVFATAFGLAGVVAAFAGTAAASGTDLITPNLDLIVFLAFPAMILGGFDSPGGAVTGGLLLGWFQNIVKTYVATPPSWFPTDDLTWLGAGFDRVAIFILMILILMVRPYGLFGTEEVRRV